MYDGTLEIHDGSLKKDKRYFVFLEDVGSEWTKLELRYFFTSEHDVIEFYTARIFNIWQQFKQGHEPRYKKYKEDLFLIEQMLDMGDYYIYELEPNAEFEESNQPNLTVYSFMGPNFEQLPEQLLTEIRTYNDEIKNSDAEIKKKKIQKKIEGKITELNDLQQQMREYCNEFRTKNN